MTSTPDSLPLTESKTWTDFSILTARFVQTERLDGNSGASILQLVGEAGYWEFSSDNDTLRIALRGTSEHKNAAQALRWLADRLDAAI